MSLPNRKVSKTFPCKCGHPWKLHDWAGIPIGDEYCNGQENNARTVDGYSLSWRCQCMMFVPDNLKYLEQCDKKRGKLK